MLNMGKNRTTIADVAERAGVSKSIVSNYLNRKFNHMTDETKERIERAIEELKYIPDHRRRNYKPKKTGVIGLIIPDIMDPFLTLITKGITESGLKYGYQILIGNSNYNIVSENCYLDAFQGMTDGIILSTIGRNDKKISGLHGSIPLVLLDRRISDQKYDVISSNNYESMQELMTFLTGNGYDSFAFFSEELVEGTSRLTRHQSYMEFAGQKHLTIEAYAYTINFYDEKILISSLLDFMGKAKRKKSAVICVNGRTLTHVLSGIQSLKWNIPKDMGVCGYDDFEAVTLLHNGITTISQPTYEMAYRSIERVIERIHNNHLKPKEINLNSKLIIRGSV